ncbi:MAG TPA: hypothetical protein VIV54_13995 [Burkholderiales bacterium]
MLKKILLAATALGFSGVALADPPYWAPAHGWRAKHERKYYEHHEHYRPYYYAAAPRPVYVMPAPRIVYTPPPPPAVVYAPAPVYHPAPVYMEPSVSIRLNFPL